MAYRYCWTGNADFVALAQFEVSKQTSLAEEQVN